MGYVSLDFMQQFYESKDEIKVANKNEEKIKLVKLNVNNLIDLYYKKEEIKINEVFNILNN